MAGNPGLGGGANGAPVDSFGGRPNLVWGAATALERGQCVALPDEMIPPDARVEIEAKIAAGYFAGNRMLHASEGTVGRGLEE